MTLRGEVLKRSWEAAGWLETEGSGGTEHVKRGELRRNRRSGFQGTALPRSRTGQGVAPPRRSQSTHSCDEGGVMPGEQGVQEGGDVKSGPCGKKPTTLPYG